MLVSFNSLQEATLSWAVRTTPHNMQLIAFRFLLCKNYLNNRSQNLSTSLFQQIYPYSLNGVQIKYLQMIIQYIKFPLKVEFFVKNTVLRI